MQWGKSSVGGLIDGEHEDFVLPMNQREMPALDLLHHPESHHPLVSLLEASEGRRPNDLYPFSFLFRKISEHGITWRGEWWYSLRGT